MTTRSKAVEDLLACFGRLPGIGPKTSERLAYHLLSGDEKEARALADAIIAARAATKVCATCFNLDETDPCGVCSDSQRNRSIILVVEDPRDVAAFEQSDYQGLYHVLQGRVSTLEGTRPDDLTVAALVRRVREAKGAVKELCLATNPDLEGEATARMVQERLAELGVATTRLARGLPAGATIHQASQSMLSDAVEGRRPLA